MATRKAKWDVTLHRYPLNGRTDVCPRIMLKGNVTLDQLAADVEERTNIYREETARAIISVVTDLVEEYLAQGYSVTSELGTLSPVVTGLWNSDRVDPAARAQNKAQIRFSESKRMKKLLDGMLFNVIRKKPSGPEIEKAPFCPVNEEWESVIDLTRPLLIEGKFLLMNGDDPSRGLYFVDADTGKTMLHIPVEDILLDERSKMMVQMHPGDLPPGRYYLRVVSQCTTNSRPLNEPRAGQSEVVFRVYG